MMTRVRHGMLVAGLCLASVAGVYAERATPSRDARDVREISRDWRMELAVAQEAIQVNPHAYPTMTDALSQIEVLRTSGKGWGQVAKEMGWKPPQPVRGH